MVTARKLEPVAPPRDQWERDGFPSYQAWLAHQDELRTAWERERRAAMRVQEGRWQSVLRELGLGWRDGCAILDARGLPARWDPTTYTLHAEEQFDGAIAGAQAYAAALLEEPGDYARARAAARAAR